MLSYSCMGGIDVIGDILTGGIDEASFWPMLAKKSLKALAINLQSVDSVLSIRILEGRLLFIGFKFIINNYSLKSR